MARNDLREQPVIVVVKRNGRQKHRGGAWKVAFADFMTAMMAVFLVLWIISQSTDVRSAIAGYFQDPLGRADEFGSSIVPGPGAARPPLSSPLTTHDVLDPRIDRLGRMAAHLEQRLLETPELKVLEGQIEIEMTDEALKIHLLEDSLGVFFEEGETRPAENGRALLMMLGQELSQIPNHIVIEGHTDARQFATGSRYGNWELSTERANAARRLLVAGGLRDRQIDEVRGFADRQLRASSDPYAAENRRVTITVQIGTEAAELLSRMTVADSTGTNIVSQLRFLRFSKPRPTSSNEQPDDDQRSKRQ